MDETANTDGNEILILDNIGELITCSDPWLIREAALIIDESTGKIKDLGPREEMQAKYDFSSGKLVDVDKSPVLPGFIDPHTHFVFGGYREDEYLWRLEGQSYAEIMEKGGGIINTVAATRAASFNNLYDTGYARLNSYLAQGVTTIEGKSGYGLKLEAELKQLDVMRKLHEDHPLDIVQTFMGAHSVSEEFSGNQTGFVNYVIEEMLPEVAKRSDVNFCDVFCDQGVFTVEETRKILKRAQELGFKAKLHVDEIAYVGGAELAAELKAISAEHLLKVSDQGIKDMKEAGVVPVILPLTAFSLQEEYAPAKKMAAEGLDIAIATDFNPGSSYSNSVPLLLNLAASKMKLEIKDVVNSFTINAAKAIDREDEIGSLEPGKYADILVLDAPSYKHLIYKIGGNVVDKVYKKGLLVHKKEKLYYEK
ncbi:MAG: imidazolonepropionase [Bacillota bacterium]